MSQVIALSYGAFEIKRRYQAHMLAGLAAATVMAFVPLALMWLFSSQPIEIPLESPPQPVDSIRIFIPRSIIVDPEEPVIRTRLPKAEDLAVGIPLPVPDDAISGETPAIHSPNDPKIQDGQVGNGNGASDGNGVSGNSVSPAPDTAEYIPSPDKFVPHEIEPEPVFEGELQYPRLALEGGFTARLQMQAYVDKTGTARVVQVISCSRPGMGFEEAAVAAGCRNKYRPAIQNGYPIGVWIAYRVEFKLARE